MFRFSIVVVVSSFIVACGGMDSQDQGTGNTCSGAFCPSSLTSGAKDAGMPGLSANYGRACTIDVDRCSDVPEASRCEYIEGKLGACVMQVRATCPTGTTFMPTNGGLCLKPCSVDADCPAATACFVDRGLQVCMPPSVYGSQGGARAQPIGGLCGKDVDCVQGTSCAKGASGGMCTMPCNTTAACGVGATCIVLDSSSSSAARCFQRCASPGSQSTCRTGFSCSPITGVTYGFCL